MARLQSPRPRLTVSVGVCRMPRLLMRVSGVVQGVGFRPHVHALATRCGLSGFVRTGGDGVRIEVEGDEDALRRFQIELTERPPASSRIIAVAAEELSPTGGCGFFVAPSRDPAGGLSFAPADVATCDDCLAELFDSADRR